MHLSQLENLPCKVDVEQSGLASVTFTLPEEQVTGFVAVLTSLSTLFRGVAWKTKTNNDSIHRRNLASLPERLNRIGEFEMCCEETFLSYLKNGDSPRECLSLTVSAVSSKFEFASYDIIKNVLTKKRLLKKTGYYKDIRHYAKMTKK